MDPTEWIGVFITNFDIWKSNKILFEAVITVYLVDRENGECVSTSTPTKVKNQLLSSLMLFRHYSVIKGSPSPTEKGLLHLEEKISTLNSNQKILMFEVSDMLLEEENSDLEKARIAWAFLVPVASDGTKNIDKGLKLQLYKVGNKCKINHNSCNIFHLYKDHKLKKFKGTLDVSITGISRAIDQSEWKLSRNSALTDTNKIIDDLKRLHFAQKMFQWSRLPTQTCKIPNYVHRTLNFGHKGSSFVQFSRSGTRLAVSSAFSIFVYDLSGVELFTLNGHNGFIFGLDWSQDDTYLLSFSNDCTCIVWSMTDRNKIYVLPHPSFVYCGKWLTSNETLVTGCRDHLLRYWMKVGGEFELVEELHGHPGFISALAVKDETTLISGDSEGCILMYGLRDKKWSIIKQLRMNEMSQGVIDAVHLCSRGTRVIITSRSKGSFMIDLDTGIIVQKYKAIVNVILRTIPCLTPCGSLFFGFCQNGEVGVWNVYTGKHLANYDSLFPIEGLAEICGSLHYNPFEHMIVIGALGENYPVLILKYEQEDYSKNLGLTLSDGKVHCKITDF